MQRKHIFLFAGFLLLFGSLTFAGFFNLTSEKTCLSSTPTQGVCSNTDYADGVNLTLEEIQGETYNANSTLINETLNRSFSFNISILCAYFYPSGQHYVEISIYNWTAGGWQAFLNVTEQDTFIMRNITDLPTKDFSDEGKVMIQWEHPDEGVSSHLGTVIDWIGITGITSLDGVFISTFEDSKESSLVGYWEFEGNANDETGVYNGTVEGNPLNVTGRVGQAFEFDGSTEYIDISFDQGLNITGDFTISAWGKTKGVSGGSEDVIFVSGFVFGDKQGINLRFSNSGTIDGYVGNGTALINVDADTAFNLNQWYYVNLVRDGTEVSIFVDGVKQIDTKILAGDIVYAPSHLIHISQTGASSMNGSIDSVKIYNRALSAQEILKQYQMDNGTIQHNTTIFQTLTCSPDNATDPQGDELTYIYDWRKDGVSDAVLNMPFDVNVTTDITDYSTNANSGTGTDLTWTTDCSPNFNSGGCYEFDGISSFIEVPHSESLSPTDEISISAWIKPLTPMRDYAVVVVKPIGTWISGGYGLTRDLNTTDLSFWINEFTNKVVVPFSYNEWQHVVGTYDGEDMKIFNNGVLIDQKEYTLPITQGTEVLRIGKPINFSYMFNGIIDQLMIWNRTLSANEIKMLYEQGTMNQLLRYDSFSTGEEVACWLGVTDSTNIISALSSTVYATEQVDTCRDLDEEGRIYNLTADINWSGGTCFIVTAENVTLDCQGYTVNGSGQTGLTYGFYTDQLNTTIKNCIIDRFNKSIKYYTADNGLILNTTSITSATGGFGIWLDTNANYNEIINSTGISTLLYGIYIKSASNYNNITNSNGISTVNMGLYIQASANNQIINSTGTSTSFYGIYFNTGSYNQLINSTGTSTTQTGIKLYSTKYNNITNSNGISTTQKGIYLQTNANYNQIINSNGSSNSGEGIYISDSSFNIFNATDANSNTKSGYYFETYAENNTIDCKGIILNGTNTTDTFGIYSDSDNTTVKNCIIDRFSTGIYYYRSDNGRIDNVTTYTTAQGGAWWEANLNGNGILFRTSDNNLVINSNASAVSGNGILFFHSSNYNKIINSSGDSRISSTAGITISGNSGDSYYNQIINSIGTSISGIGIVLYDSKNNNITNSIGISDIDRGIYLSTGSNYNTIINSNGSSDSGYGIQLSDSSFNTFNATYAESNSKSGYHIISDSENNTIDCKGITINGTNTSGTYGIYSDSLNTTIKNCIIDRFDVAVHYENAYSGLILNNSLTSSVLSGRGLNITNAYYNRVINNTILSDSVGAYLIGASYTNVTNNSMTSKGKSYAIWIRSTQNCFIENNTFITDQGVTTSATIQLTAGDYNTIRGNYANASGSASGVAMRTGSDYNNVSNNTLEGYIGVYLGSTDNFNNIYDNLVVGRNDGIFSTSSADNTLVGNTITSVYNPIDLISSPRSFVMNNVLVSTSSYEGLRVSSTSYSVFINNNASSNTGVGILVLNSDYNNFTGNNVSSNTGVGIKVESSSFNVFISNNATSNNAIGIHVLNSDYNNLTSNNATSTGANGIRLEASDYNIITNSTGTSITSTGGIYIAITSSYNTLINSIGTAGTSGGIYIYANSNYNNILNSTGTAGTDGGIYLRQNSHNNNIINSTAIGLTSYGLSIRGSEQNNITKTYISTGGTVAIHIENSDLSIFRNNTINSSATCIEITADSTNNTFFYNSLYNCSTYVNNENATNTFNTTVGGVAQGNYYDDILTHAIYDGNFNGYGDWGEDYPYNASLATWTGEGADYAPIRPYKFNLSYIFPSKPTYLNNQNMTLNVSLKTNTTITINLNVDGVLNDSQTFDANTTVNFTYNFPADGRYTYNITVNGSINYSLPNRTYIYDTTNPLINISSPTNNTIYPTNFTINVTIYDINLWAFSVNITNSTGGLFYEDTIENITATTYNYTNSSNLSVEGVYSITFKACDDSNPPSLGNINNLRGMTQRTANMERLNLEGDRNDINNSLLFEDSLTGDSLNYEVRLYGINGNERFLPPDFTREVEIKDGAYKFSHSQSMRQGQYLLMIYSTEQFTKRTDFHFMWGTNRYFKADGMPDEAYLESWNSTHVVYRYNATENGLVVIDPSVGGVNCLITRLNITYIPFNITYGTVFTEDTIITVNEATNFIVNATAKGTWGASTYTNLPNEITYLYVENATANISFTNGTGYVSFNASTGNYTIKYGQILITNTTYEIAEELIIDARIYKYTTNLTVIADKSEITETKTIHFNIPSSILPGTPKSNYAGKADGMGTGITASVVGATVRLIISTTHNGTKSLTAGVHETLLSYMTIFGGSKGGGKAGGGQPSGDLTQDFNVTPKERTIRLQMTGGIRDTTPVLLGEYKITNNGSIPITVNIDLRELPECRISSGGNGLELQANESAVIGIMCNFNTTRVLLQSRVIRFGATGFLERTSILNLEVHETITGTLISEMNVKDSILDKNIICMAPKDGCLLTLGKTENKTFNYLRLGDIFVFVLSCLTVFSLYQLGTGKTFRLYLFYLVMLALFAIPVMGWYLKIVNLV